MKINSNIQALVAQNVLRTNEEKQAVIDATHAESEEEDNRDEEFSETSVNSSPSTNVPLEHD